MEEVGVKWNGSVDGRGVQGICTLPKGAGDLGQRDFLGHHSYSGRGDRCLVTDPGPDSESGHLVGSL